MAAEQTPRNVCARHPAERSAVERFSVVCIGACRCRRSCIRPRSKGHIRYSLPLHLRASCSKHFAEKSRIMLLEFQAFLSFLPFTTYRRIGLGPWKALEFIPSVVWWWWWWWFLLFSCLPPRREANHATVQPACCLPSPSISGAEMVVGGGPKCRPFPARSPSRTPGHVEEVNHKIDIKSNTRPSY